MEEQKPIDRLRKRIEKYKEAGQWDQAASEYENLLTFYPNDAELHKQTGDAYLKDHQDMTALKFYLIAAQNFEDDQELDKAIALLKKILKIKPALHDVKVRIADLYARQEKVSDAMDHYEDTITSFTELGSKHEMLAVYKKIVEMKPDNLIMHRKLADQYVEHNLLAQAIVEYRSLLKKVKKIGLHTEIVNILSKIIELEPSSFDESLELIQIYYKTAQFERALEEIQNLLTKNPDYTKAYRSIGDVLMEIGRPEEALTAYFKYLNGHPRDLDVLRTTIMLQVEFGQLKPALEDAKILIDQYLAQEDITAAREILILFKDEPCPDISYQELYVKLLCTLELEESFSLEIQKLIELFLQNDELERIDKIQTLLSEQKPMATLKQFLKSGPVKLRKHEEHDLIDELAHLSVAAADDGAKLTKEQKIQKFKDAEIDRSDDDHDVIDELPPRQGE
ncbi:tetratricopeptide repeat protein [candidate division CSSED10-310 bacterium]|uniref:Tetratricopeptide repeat protein n=1 Tax=candidate division CSSED10-310 bacterium TaxID=2855610 RepID=A0ABV6Z5T2_UNCC1